MRLELKGGGKVELSIQIGIDEELRLLAVRVMRPSDYLPLATSRVEPPSRATRRLRARARRDMTVPTGISAMAAISL